MIDSCPAQTDPFYVALIAAGGAILGTILKDFVFRIWERRRDKSDNLVAIYARYGEPLLSASSKLMWRLGEIFKHPVMAGFLKTDIYAPSSSKYAVFSNYKKISTLYRLAELLAWVRACRIEFSSLRVADAKKAKPVETAFHRLECALADGPQVQLERLNGLSQLWNIQLPGNSDLLTTIGIDMEAKFDRFLVSSGASDLEKLTSDERFTLLRSISDAITTPLAIKPIDGTLLLDRSHIALKILDIREAWIYRDWQTAIGDLLLKRVDRPDRTYDVIGFSEFEAMCTSGTDDQMKWIARLSAVFDDVDIATRDPYDHRPDQLRKILKATAALTLELSKCVTGCNLTPETIVEAERLSK
jgi:hypothetical protein